MVVGILHLTYLKCFCCLGDDESVDGSVKADNKLRVHDGAIFQQQDMLVPWDSSNKEAQYLRYYHLFVEGEMEALVKQLDNCKLTKSFHEQGNWFVEFQKI